MTARCSDCLLPVELRRDGRSKVHRDEDGQRCAGSQQPPHGGIHRPAWHPVSSLPPKPLPLRVHVERGADHAWFRFRSRLTRRMAYAAAPGAWTWDRATRCSRLPAERVEQVITALKRRQVVVVTGPPGSAPWGPTSTRTKRRSAA